MQYLILLKGATAVFYLGIIPATSRLQAQFPLYYAIATFSTTRAQIK
uniref:Uncharacterized protein n=1 Tax=Anguilla anguilla TaxID=7936 RepID=A0A0E9RM70_ANGAN